MAVPILRLHYLGAVDGGLAHVLNVLGLMFWVLGVGVCKRVGPHFMDLDGFFRIRGLLQDVGGLHGLLVLVVFGALCEQGLLCRRGDLEGCNVDGSLGHGIKGDHRKGTGHEDMLGQYLLALCHWCFRDLESDFHATSAGGEGDLSAQLEVADLPDRVL